MTGQIPDTLVYLKKKYEIVGIDGSELFDPLSHGFFPEMIHTACYRGYICAYRVVRKKLLLADLTIRSYGDVYPDLAGISGVLQDGGAVAKYKKLNLTIDFSGRLRLGAEFDNRFYVHMGFQKPSAYRIVVDANFEDGLLIEWRDRSKEFDSRRGEFKRDYEFGRPLDGIEEAFSLDIDDE